MNNSKYQHIEVRKPIFLVKFYQIMTVINFL